MKKFYLRLKIFYTIGAIFLFVILFLAGVNSAVTGNWAGTGILLFGIALIAIIAFGILQYYKNMVIDIAFESANAIITTNSRTFSVPNAHFVEVNDARSFGKIFILYADGNRTKRLVFQKKYSPFHSYSLNLDAMKQHMTSAVFKVS